MSRHRPISHIGTLETKEARVVGSGTTVCRIMHDVGDSHQLLEGEQIIDQVLVRNHNFIQNCPYQVLFAKHRQECGASNDQLG
jgi:hypothetical protein